MTSRFDRVVFFYCVCICLCNNWNRQQIIVSRWFGLPFENHFSHFFGFHAHIYSIMMLFKIIHEICMCTLHILWLLFLCHQFHISNNYQFQILTSTEARAKKEQKFTNNFWHLLVAIFMIRLVLNHNQYNQWSRFWLLYTI